MAADAERLPQFDDRGAGYKSGIPQSNDLLQRALVNAAPQSAIVLEYLASGRGLSVLIAHTVLGVTSLTTRIAELRKLPLPITGTWHQDHGGKRFMVYKYEPGKEPTDEALHLDNHPIFDPAG